jgi:hypothetical protein
MSVLILAAALAFGQPTPVRIAACAPAQTTPTAAAGRLKPKRLTDLPPGYFMRTVLRRVGDCSVMDVRSDGAWVRRLDGVAPTAPIPAGR